MYFHNLACPKTAKAQSRDKIGHHRASQNGRRSEYTVPMTAVDKILDSIDAEIARLKRVRALLSTDGTKKTTTTPSGTPKKRKLSAAARKRIGDAQRKRWAKQKAEK